MGTLDVNDVAMFDCYLTFPECFLGQLRGVGKIM